MSKVFYRKQFSDYLGENRSILDVVVGFVPDGVTPQPSPVTPTPTPTPSVTPIVVTPTVTSTSTSTPTPTSTLAITPSSTSTPTPTPTSGFYTYSIKSGITACDACFASTFCVFGLALAILATLRSAVDAISGLVGAVSTPAQAVNVKAKKRTGIKRIVSTAQPFD
jgi:hypothetical protein